MYRGVVGFLFLSIASPVVALKADAGQKFDAAFQNIIDTASYLAGHTGISLGVALPDRTVSLATGWKDLKKMEPLRPDDRLAIGASTTLMTATAVMKLVQNKMLKLDEVALPQMDILMQKVSQHSFTDFLGPMVSKVTIRDLLHMTSGLGEYASKAGFDALYSNPGSNTDGFDLENILSTGMRTANAERTAAGDAKGYEDSFICGPGECGEYSSTNYMLLGMVLAQNAGVQNWGDYDQSSFLTPKLRMQMRSTIFPLRGRFSEFTDVHGYESFVDSKTNRKRVIDTHDHNCNTGWTVSNAMSSGKDMALFLRALLGKDAEVLNSETRQEMLKMRWLEMTPDKTSISQFYGMGIKDLSAQLYENPMKAMMNPEIFHAGILLGQDSVSPGGYYSFNAYAPRHDFAFSFIMNNVEGMKMTSFLTKKIYDLACSMADPVEAPLKPEYENIDMFYKQKWYKQIKRNRVFAPTIV